MQIRDFKIINFGSGLPGKKSTCTNEGQHEKNEEPGQKMEDFMLTEKKHGFLSIFCLQRIQWAWTNWTLGLWNFPKKVEHIASSQIRTLILAASQAKGHPNSIWKQDLHVNNQMKGSSNHPKVAPTSSCLPFSTQSPGLFNLTVSFKVIIIPMITSAHRLPMAASPGGADTIPQWHRRFVASPDVT